MYKIRIYNEDTIATAFLTEQLVMKKHHIVGVCFEVYYAIKPLIKIISQKRCPLKSRKNSKKKQRQVEFSLNLMQYSHAIMRNHKL